MNIVIVGGGLAAATAVEELRTAGHTGDVVVLAAESHLPYHRPPLSKGLLLGDESPDSVAVHDQAWYDDHGVDLRLGTAATGLDLDRRHVLVGEDEIAFDRLLLATGAAPRRFPPADEAWVPVMTLRTLDDATRLRERLDGLGRLVVLGAGWIGLEVAAAARAAGVDVTVLEAMDLPLQAALGPQVAPVLADLHREHGVDLRLGARVTGVTGGADRVELQLGDDRVTGDLLLVGVGAAPDVALAEAAGLPCDNGVLVNARLRTSAPHVFAAGDVANHDHPVLGRIRVEHWDTAIGQGRAAARVMLGGDEPCTALPYFFSDQYDLGLEYLGRHAPDDELALEGDLEGRKFRGWWRRDGRIVAGMHVNDWDAMEEIRARVGT